MSKHYTEEEIELWRQAFEAQQKNKTESEKPVEPKLTDEEIEAKETIEKLYAELREVSKQTTDAYNKANKKYDEYLELEYIAKKLRDEEINKYDEFNQYINNCQNNFKNFNCKYSYDEDGIKVSFDKNEEVENYAKVFHSNLKQALDILGKYFK